ncbi:MAG: transcription-repair coupling factor [Ferrimicrobium sp.]
MSESSLGGWFREVGVRIGSDAVCSGAVSEAIAPASALLCATMDPGAALVVIVDTEELARHVAGDLEGYGLGLPVFVLPPWETLPFERVSPSVATVGARLAALYALHARADSGVIVVASVRSVMQRLAPAAVQPRPLHYRRGYRLDRDEVIAWLIAQGYVRESQVGVPGEFAVRGSILDIYTANGLMPTRIDLFGDEVETIVEFDPESQLRASALDEVVIFPAREIGIDAWLRERVTSVGRDYPMLKARLESMVGEDRTDPIEGLVPFLLESEAPIVTDLLAPGDQIILGNRGLVGAYAARVLADEESICAALAPTWGVDEVEEVGTLHAPFKRIEDSAAALRELDGSGTSVDSFAVSYRDVEGALSRIQALIKDGFRVVVTAQSEARATSLADGFARFDRFAPIIDAKSPLPESPGMVIVHGVSLYTSAIVGPGRFAIVTDAGLVRPLAPPKTGRAKRAALEGVSPGTLVVHEGHGIARYEGLVTRQMGGVERDYLLLEFAGSDRIYLPSEQIGKLTPYVGGENPALSRLGGGEWQRNVAKARRAASEVAQELVVLYQKRLVTLGHAVALDTPWQREVEDLFPYTLTDDQVVAIADVKADLERPTPMDRMLCGDVGFGKTEVALRVAFKVIQDGGQVAILAPTTLLASQHFETFSERFANFPVKVAMLSRFVSAAQAKRTVAAVADGTVDCLVATHALLARSVRFRRLGLLVVDEEQRFGVAHKEALKQHYPDVDVLTLSATPIPRTLELSLVGIRDLSLLRTPPINRQPILTHVGPDDESAVAEAIRREILRGGQVFYVHNRVRDIDGIARRIADLVPSARVVVAHGQMKESDLERVVEQFWHRRADVLVCTTIIESGIDLPSVNTLIVDHAETLGLAQLHQLRGRVGRSGERAYAYLFFPVGAAMSDIAIERLRTIAENTDLGAGYRIALRDLELRGAGTVLGERQSGHMASVGYDLYVRLVADAVASMKGEVMAEAPVVKIDLPVSYSIPSDYVEDEEVRLELYRRLLAIEHHSVLEALGDELRDRFGPPPEPVKSLIRVGALRVDLVRLGVREVRTGRSAKTGRVELVVSPVALAQSRQLRLRRQWPRATYREGLGELAIEMRSNEDPVALVRDCILGVLDSPNVAQSGNLSSEKG